MWILYGIGIILGASIFAVVGIIAWSVKSANDEFESYSSSHPAPSPQREPVDVYYGREVSSFPRKYVSIDVETTGLSEQNDDIIDVACVHVSDGEIIDTYTSLVKNTVHVNGFIKRLTGLSDDDLSSAPSQTEAITKVLDFIGDSTLVAHNANFDMKFLSATSMRYLNRSINNSFIDTLTLAKVINTNIENKKLDTLKKHYEITEEAHRALGDALSVTRLFEKYRDYAIRTYGSTDAFIVANHLPNSGHYGLIVSVPKSSIELYSGHTFFENVVIKQEEMPTGKNKGKMRLYFESTDGVRLANCSMQETESFSLALQQVGDTASCILVQVDERPSVMACLVGGNYVY